jgi:transcriptional regulator with XRE-family HTH domain
MAILGRQLRAARALAGMGQLALAEASDVGLNTIRKMEARGNEKVRVRTDTLELLTEALRDAGVEFTGEDDGRAGVRLIHPCPALVARRGRTGTRRT